MSIEQIYKLYKQGQEILDLTEIKSINFGYGWNQFKMCNFEYNANNLDPDVRDNLVFGSELRIFRRGFSETSRKLIYAGEIQEPTRKIDKDNNKTYSVQVIPWGNIFYGKRRITKTFTAQDESDIVKGIIDDIQTNTFSGTYLSIQIDWGITQGSYPSSGNTRTIDYVDTVALQAMQEIPNLDDSVFPSRVRGFRLTPDIKIPDYHVASYEPDMGEDTLVTYTNEQIESIIESSPTIKYANRIDANGANNLQRTAFRTAGIEVFKLRHDQVSRTNIKDSQALFDAATDEVDIVFNPQLLYSIDLLENDPFVGEYRVGDTIKIVYTDSEDFIDLNATFRVFGIDISYDQAGVEKVKLTIALDRPITLNTDPVDRLVDRFTKNESRLNNLEK